MAWVNVPLPIETGEVTDSSLWTLSDGTHQQTSPYGIVLNEFESYSQAFQNIWLFGDENGGIRQYAGSTTNGYRFYPKDPQASEAPYKNAINSGMSNVSGITICCGYDPNSGNGTVIFHYSYVWNSRTYYTIAVCRGLNYFCQYMYNNPPITYTWQSVPSISGKNGILSLVTLDSESINDGEPVSGAAISVFNQNPVSENNVKDIVDANIPITPSAVNVTAKFVIGAMSIGDLASRVIVAKKGSIPESIEDGDTVMTIPAGTNEITIPNLDEDSEYYFSIFVADSYGNEAVSDPKSCSTGIRPIEPSNEVITIIAKAYSDGYQEKVTATKEEN